MPNFEGYEDINLQQHDKDITYSFEFPIKSTASAKAGFLPYGTTMSGVSVTATKDDGTDATSDLIQSTTHNTNTAFVTISYPTVNGDGNYKLTFVVTASNGSEFEADFDRVRVKNL